MAAIKPEREQKELEQRISTLKKVRDLEQGRNEVLRMVAQEENLELILNTLCRNAQIYNDKIITRIKAFLDKENEPYYEAMRPLIK